MINFTLKELAQFAKCELVGEDAPVYRVSTNSKDCAYKNTLFIALKGERFDAHNFLDDALKNGASYFGVSDSKNVKGSYLLCDDTQRLLGKAGELVRLKTHAKVCSITGSCGKTTVKEMCLSILSNMGKSMATKGNFNNDIGVPLTLLQMDESTDYAVIEQGASHLLDIKRTSEYVKSDACVITNVGAAHIEGFGSYDGVYKGKSEILDDVLSRGGIGIVPSDSKYLDNWLLDYKEYVDSGKLRTFGFKDNSFVTIRDLKESLENTSFTLVTKDFECDIKLNLLGAHNAQNAAAACALCLTMGATKEAIVKGLNDTVTTKGRFHIVDKNDFILIDDAYNASANAVMAAIDTLSKFAGYKIFVFADMGELGSEAVALHQKIGSYAKKNNIDRMLCLGPLSMHTVKAMGNGAMHFANHESLLTFLDSIIDNTTQPVVLVKGSHAMHMEKIVGPLLNRERKKC